MKWVKILKNKNTDESQKYPLIFLQPFLRLAYTTCYNRKETIFGASRRRLVFPIFCAIRIFENIHQIGPGSCEKTVVCEPIYTTEQSDNLIKAGENFFPNLKESSYSN